MLWKLVLGCYSNLRSTVPITHTVLVLSYVGTEDIVASELDNIGRCKMYTTNHKVPSDSIE